MRQPSPRSFQPSLVMQCLGLLGLASVLVVAGHAITTGQAPAVASVAQVWTGLARDPPAWRDRVLLVRGVITPLPESCRCHHIELLPDGSVPLILRGRSAEGPGLSPYMALVLTPQPAVLATLRRWPVLHSLIPAPQSPVAGRVATYWIRIQAIPHVVCDLCYDAVLLDTASPSRLLSLRTHRTAPAPMW